MTPLQKQRAFTWAVVNSTPIPLIARRLNLPHLEVTKYLLEATCYNSNYGIGRSRLRWQ